jgi:Tol biopolymer transport system component
MAGAAVTAGLVYWVVAEDDPARDGAPNWSPDSQTIVFAAETGQDPADIWAMRADGSGRERLTRGASNDTSPAFSPDGREIAFESDRDGSSEIYVMDRSGNNVRRLTTNPATDGAPAWSPDGTRLAFTSNRNSRASNDIYTMDARDGSDVQRVTTDLANWAPQYSPDGRSLAVQVNQDVVIIDLVTGASRQLTGGRSDGMNPTWSPDGQRIAFVTRRNGPAEIFTMRADGSDQTVLVSMPRGGAIDPRWSPDGTRIAFVFLPAVPADGDIPASVERQAIYTIDLASGRVTRLSP